ncbi:hypothetical protein [Streptomyces sp. H27-D2]|nr:hypothetical protein [Streptomyces sp. H27-D2]MEC4015433.1 hypothetical protein [Streptomyces sp. H27-D2]
MAVLAGIVWTGVMYLFIRDPAIAGLCGLAFAGVLGFTLPRPPAP